MYDKRYILRYITEPPDESLYSDIVGNVCYPAYFRVGEKGWFLMMNDVENDVPQRVCIPVVKSVQFAGDGFVVRTEGRRFSFIETL